MNSRKNDIKWVYISEEIAKYIAETASAISILTIPAENALRW
jgi:hypothetical protein